MRRIKGHFEKQELQVDLSEEVPLSYTGPEQKYVLADYLSRAHHFKYEKTTLDFDLYLYEPTGEFLQTPERVRCYLLISAMPEAALSEAEETLREMQEHYASLEASANKALPPAPRMVQANVVERVRT